ncbi:hypothetical protein HG531_012905 [Fusarium graminearum]|nr:hypothetical protein HG531_012905 [Fusarium graminearum]
MLLEDMLDQRNNVLGLGLGKLDERRRLEHIAKLLHLGNLHKLLGVLLSLSRSSRHGLGTGGLGRANLGSLEGGGGGNQLLRSVLGISLLSSNHRNLGDIEGAIESRRFFRGDIHNELLLEVGERKHVLCSCISNGLPVGGYCFLTILDEANSHLVILLIHELEVKSSTVTDLIINVVQASGEENANTALDIGVLLADTELSKGGNGSSSDNSVLENDSVVNVSNVLGRLSSLGTLKTNKMEDSDSQLSELAILDKFAKVSKRILLGVGNKLDQVKHAFHNSPLELITTLIAQDTAKEGVDGVGLEAGEVVEDSESGKLGDGARRGQEELEDMDSLRYLSIGNISHVADGLGSLKVDHFALMSQPAIEKLHHGLPQ